MKIATLLLLAAGCASASPLLLVLNKEDATLSVIDLAANQTLGTVATGESPHELAVSSDGKLAFASNYGSRTPGSSISVIDIATRKELRRVDVAPLQRPHGLAESQGKLLFTAEGSKVFAAYDPAANKIEMIMGTGQNATHMVMASPQGDRIYTANIGSDSISIFERAGQGGWNQTVIGVGKGPEGMDLSPNGKELWAAHSRDGSISVIDLAAKKVTGTIDIGTKRSNRLKFTPDGKYVLISDMEGNELIVLNADSRQPAKKIAVGKAPEGICITPAGDKAYIAVSGENKIAVLDLKTLAVTGSIPTGKSPDGMALVDSK